MLGADGTARAQREAANLQRLAGIHGVPKLIAGPAGASLLLEDQPGTTLATMIEQAVLADPGAGLPELTEMLDLAVALADLLAEVHQRGIVHKDINPAHILIRAVEHTPVLMGFELAGS